jgi:DNA-binding PadR family transcriptional regulator
MRKSIKDEVWMVRKAMSPPNFAVLDFLSTRAFSSGIDLYHELTKKFTRKTIIASLATLSTLKLIEPYPIKSTAGYRIGYKISEIGKQLVEEVKEISKKIEKEAQKAKSP